MPKSQGLQEKAKALAEPLELIEEAYGVFTKNRPDMALPSGKVPRRGRDKGASNVEIETTGSENALIERSKEGQITENERLKL